MRYTIDLPWPVVGMSNVRVERVKGESGGKGERGGERGR